MITLQDLITETLNIFESEDIKRLEKERMRLYMKVKNWKKSGKDTSELEKQLNDAKKRLSDAKKAARSASKGAVVTPQQTIPPGDDSLFGDLGTAGFGALDIDSLMNIDHTEITKAAIKDFILNNYKVNEFIYERTYIIDKINGEFVVSAPKNVVSMEKSQADSLTGGLFKWGEVESFFVLECHNIKTLEGAPQKCDHFQIERLDELISLQGAPKTTQTFQCGNCKKLKSLEGAPQECNLFSCNNCINLKSLKGCPKKVDKVYCFNTGIINLEGLPKTSLSYLNCAQCCDLTSLKGCPARLKKLDASFCKKLTSKDYLPPYTTVYAKYCPAFEK